LTGEFFVKCGGGNIFVFIFLLALKEFFDTRKLLGATKVSAQIGSVSGRVLVGDWTVHSLVPFGPWYLFAVCV
jgi:hypothetical protein